jgi:DNA replication protein DnaC
MSLPQLQRGLRELRLAGMIPMLETRARQVEQRELSFLEALASLVQDEMERRRTRVLERRMAASGVPDYKGLDDFDWAFNPAIPKDEILDLAALDFIGARQSVLFIGPAGVGKSHCATALALLALERGYNVLYRKAERLIAELEEARSRGDLGRLWTELNGAELLVIDDLFRRELPPGASEHLTMVLTRRCERLATLVSSGRHPSEWSGLLGSAAVAVLDRLVRQARLLKFDGCPWRVR